MLLLLYIYLLLCRAKRSLNDGWRNWHRMKGLQKMRSCEWLEIMNKQKVKIIRFAFYTIIKMSLTMIQTKLTEEICAWWLCLLKLETTLEFIQLWQFQDGVWEYSSIFRTSFKLVNKQLLNVKPIKTNN